MTLVSLDGVLRDPDVVAAVVPGVVVADGRIEVSDADLARLTYFAGCFGAVAGVGEAVGGKAVCFGGADVDSIWTQEMDDVWAPILRRIAVEIMAFFDQSDARVMRRSMSAMLVRASSWVRAQNESVPQNLRHGFGQDDVQCEEQRRPYLDFFMVDEQDVRFRRFNGGFSEKVQRAAFVSGDAVTVLPYDPMRDRVLVIEQFRFGPFVRGDRHPWSLEPIAGRIDPGETPETSARREAIEEAGLELKELLPVANYYPSPGAMSEYLFSYVALADLPDDVAQIGGLDSEAEDIRGVLLSFDDFMGMIQSGEAQNGPLLLTAFWLKSERDRLRTSA